MIGAFETMHNFLIQNFGNKYFKNQMSLSESFIENYFMVF